MSNTKKTYFCQSNKDRQYHLDEMNELRYYMDVNNIVAYDPDHDDPDVDDPLSGDLHSLDEGNTGDDDDRVDGNEIQSAVAEHITDIHSNGNEDRRIVIPTINKYDCVAHINKFFRLRFVDVAVNMSDVKETHCKSNEDPQYHQDHINDEDIINSLNEIQSAVAEHITDIHSNGNEDRRIVIPTINKYDCVAHINKFFRLRFVDVAVNMSDVKETHCKSNEDPQYHQDHINDEDIINSLNELQDTEHYSKNCISYESEYEDLEYGEQENNGIQDGNQRSNDCIVYDSDDDEDEYVEEENDQIRDDGHRSNDFIIYDSDNDEDEYVEEVNNQIEDDGHHSNNFIIYYSDDDEDEYVEQENSEIESDVTCHSWDILSGYNELDKELVDLIYKNEKKIVDRRIVDISSLFEQIKTLNQHSESCRFDDMILTNEINEGLNSIFEFRCKVCGVFRKINSCHESDESLGSNEAAVLGMSSVGLGFYHLQEFFALLDVPCMTYSRFNKISKTQQADWWKLAKEMASDALQEEIRLAILNNEVDKFGNALIAILCDGSWGKRSYGKGFSSLSGCAVIIGLRTRKIIYFDTRNKYCHICQIARSRNSPPNHHNCNANFSGPSSAMETHIIVAGFKESVSNVVRYNKFIADGDSSTYKAIRDLRIYESSDLLVTKYECCNHLRRNFRSTFGSLRLITKFNIECRKLITPKLCEDICKGVGMATKHWQKSNASHQEKITNLEEDIINTPAHYFGVYSKCNDYFCKKTTDQGAIDTLNSLKEDGIFYEILNLCQKYFANNAISLLEGYNTNPAEGFNGLVAKYLGGKRINNSLAGSYNGRVATAVVQYNSEGRAGSEYHKFKFGNSIESNIATLENVRKRKCELNAIRNKIKPKIRRTETDKTRNYYGEDCARPSTYEIVKKRLLSRLNENQTNWNIIEKTTIGQRNNPRWLQIRQNLLPSSYFGAIINAKGRKSYKNILENILYKRSEFGNNADVRHQRLYEREALNAFKSKTNVSLEDCGIFIDPELHFLCASPTMVFESDYILSIKCPKKAFDKNFDDAIEQKLIPFWKQVSGAVVVNDKSNWYVELQGELHITRRKYAILMVWLSEFQYKIVKVSRDDDYWEKNLKAKLTYFFEEVMAKELVDSRKARNMELRTYDSQSETFM